MSRNRFEGRCYVCGDRCAPGAGTAEKSQFGRWRVQHDACAPGAVATALAPAKKPRRDKPAYRRKLAGINPW